MSTATFLQNLSQQEPWRRNLVPQNALDPAWIPEEARPVCNGEIRFEGTTRWWYCTACGYVGSSYTNHHQVAGHPLPFFISSVVLFMKRRVARPTRLQTAVHQMLYVAGVALRYASARAPDQLGQYVQKLAE